MQFMGGYENKSGRQHYEAGQAFRGWLDNLRDHHRTSNDDTQPNYYPYSLEILEIEERYVQFRVTITSEPQYVTSWIDGSLEVYNDAKIEIERSPDGSEYVYSVDRRHVVNDQSKMIFI